MIIRYDPFQEFDRFSRQLWGRALAAEPTPSMPMEVRSFADRVEASFDLPGIDPESIDVTVERDTLTVKAERLRQDPGEGEEVLVAERPYGRFSRRLSLGQSLDGSKVTARYDRGVLVLTLPIAETAKAHKVSVVAAPGSGQEAIEAKSSEAA